MKIDTKNLILGVLIGISGTLIFFYATGNIEIETDIQIGEKSEQKI